MFASFVAILLHCTLITQAQLSLSFLSSGPFGKVKKGQEMHKAVDLILAKPGMGMDRMKSRSILVYEGVVRKSCHANR